MKTNFPNRRDFEQDFLSSDGKKLFTIKYRQATLKEYFEYLEKSETEKINELYKIVKSNIKYSFLDKIFLFFNKNYLSDTEKAIKYDEVLGSIFANRYRVYESIFKKLEKKFSKNEGSPGIESSSLMAVCKEYNISPTDLLKNYTLEQYFWFLDGIRWNSNAMTKEGILENKMALIDKDSIKERARKTKEIQEKFKK